MCNICHKFIQECKTDDIDYYETQIAIHYADELAFRTACYHNNLNMVTRIYSKSKININMFNEEPFRHAYANGYLELAKWMYFVCPTINIHAWHKHAYRYATGNKHGHIVELLSTLS